MKKLIKKFLAFYLKYCVKLLLIKRRPIIIAVTGSVNRHTVKKEIFDKIKNDFNAVIGPKNYNAELGVPLAILGLETGGDSIKKWLDIMLRAVWVSVGTFKMPDAIILELAISRPEDMDYLLTIIDPEIAVITEITQKYADNFEDLDCLADEYLKIIKKLPKNGLAILNYDDLRQRNLSGIKAKIVTYGFSQGSDAFIYEVFEAVDGINFKYSIDNKIISNKIFKFGRHNIYADVAGGLIKDYLKNKNI